jgi:hypothetical protein
MFRFALTGGCATLSSQIIYVNQSANGESNGSSWQDAYKDLTVALTNYEPNATVWVAEGSYRASNNNNPIERIILNEPVFIYGGFGGYETILSERDWVAHPTILSGNIGDPLSEEDNSYAFFTVDNEFTEIDGFIFEDIFQPTQGSGLNRAPVIVAEEAKLFIRNCIFRNNQVRQFSGITNAGFSVVENCLFHNNFHFDGGNIVYTSATGIISVVNCTFVDNAFATGIGNAFGGNPFGEMMVHNTIVSNSSSQLVYSGALTVLTNSMMPGLLPGPGVFVSNILYAQPVFLDPGNNDYRLADSSPGINQGDNSYLSNDLTLDLALMPRIQGQTVDIGAYESAVEPQTCPGDFNDDGFVNSGDLLFLLADFGCMVACTADLTGNGAVDAGDLLVFLSVFGANC